MSLLQRLHQFFTKPVTEPAVAELYARCVAQARLPDFYTRLDVPDSLDGRFDLLLLHVFMVMFRLEEEKQTKQLLFDLMFSDMDRSLREMGVGDMSISRKIKPMISAFYGRGTAYQKAMVGNAEELQAALMRNLYGTVNPDPNNVRLMTDYVRRATASLAMQPVETIAAGQVDFPAPLA